MTQIAMFPPDGDGSPRVADPASPSPPRRRLDAPRSCDGVVEVDTTAQVYLVSREQVVASRYRTMLPLDPRGPRAKKVIAQIERDGYEALPARWIDGRYEVLGCEVIHDALRIMDVERIRIRHVEPASEEAAYVTGKGREAQYERPSHYELMRDVWLTRSLSGVGITWARIGAILGYERSTISHAQTDGARITPAVVARAGIDETQAEHAQRLRRATGKGLRWAGAAETEDHRAIRLATLVLGRAPAWASPEDIHGNEEPNPAVVIRTSWRRDGTRLVVAEFVVDQITDAERTSALRRLSNTLREQTRGAGTRRSARRSKRAM